MLARRIRDLPPYLFVELDRKVEEKRRRGEDVISLGIGDPDMPTPEHIIQACCSAARKPENHQYPSYGGMLEFRRAAAERYKSDYRIKLDPAGEVMALIGSKEGIHNAHFAFADPGDVVLYPEPGYPVYRSGALLAGAVPHSMPLLRDNHFLPDLEAIPNKVLKKAKMMWINYPNNPTASVAGLDFLRAAVDFAKDHKIVLCSDEAYTRIAFDGYKAPSVLQVEDAREIAIAFHSLSKTYNMTGWRIGYAVGARECISALGKVKTNVDSGVSQIIQESAVAALTSSQKCVEDNIRTYQERRDTLAKGLRKLGFDFNVPKATFYFWLPVEGSSLAFADRLLDEAGVVCTPGIGFGEHGEGYVRLAHTQPVERINEALARMEKIL